MVSSGYDLLELEFTFPTDQLQNKNLENTLELYAGHLAQTARQSYTSYENIAYSVAYNTLVQDYICLLYTSPSPRDA